MFAASVSGILNRRGFAWIAPDATLEAAADLMAAETAPALPVLVDGAPVGIVTEGDILRYASQRGGFATAPVSEAMTRRVVCIDTRASIAEAMTRMQQACVRQLTVLDPDGKAVGLLTRADIPPMRGAFGTRQPTRTGSAAPGPAELHA